MNSKTSINDQLFLNNIFRNKFMFRKILSSFVDSIVINDLSILYTHANTLQSYRNNSIPIIYKIKDIYCHDFFQQNFKYLMTHIIVPTPLLPYFKEQYQQNKLQQHPIIYGISITDPTTDDSNNSNNNNNNSLWLKEDFLQSIQYLEYDSEQNIPINYIPQSVTAIDFRHFINIEKESLPKKLKILNLGFRRSSVLDSIETLVPSSVTVLSISGLPDSHLDLDLLPSSVSRLDLRFYYGSLSGNGNIKYLRINTTFSNQLSGNLPKNLTHLEIECVRLDSQSIPRCMQSLKLITFHQPIDFAALPDSLVVVSSEFGGFKNTSAHGKPRLVKYESKYTEGSEIPFNCTDLRLRVISGITLPKLPLSVKTLYLGNNVVIQFPFEYFNNTNVSKLNIQCKNEIEPGLIPSSVTNLTINSPKQIRENVIPNSVTKLRIISPPDLDQPIIIPNSVARLCLSSLFKLNSLPNELQTLEIHHFFKRHLTTLSYLLSINSTITTLVIESIDSLDDFDKEFNIDIKNNTYDKSKLPSSLKFIKFAYAVRYLFDGKIYNEEIFDIHPTSHRLIQ